jgi:SCY1-like protein 2
MVPSEVELKIHILELLDAITFLHCNARMVHQALSPENIYITVDGQFKLAGFFFAQALTTLDAMIPAGIDFGLTSSGLSLVPTQAFTAPEIAQEGMASVASDSFSLGCLIYHALQVSNNAKPLYFIDPADRSKRTSPLETPGYAAGRLGGLPPGARELLNRLLAPQNGDRLKLNEAKTHAWFNDPRIRTLEFLDHLSDKQHQHKLQFLSGLTRVLGEFDSKTVLRLLLPRLAQCLEIDSLSAQALVPLIAILEKPGLCAPANFYESVWPHIQSLCGGKEITAQGLFHIVKNTQVWLNLALIQDFQSTMLVLYQKAMECGIVKIQEAAVSSIPLFAKKLEYATLKSAILPRILKLTLGTSLSSLRRKCLESLAQFSMFIDSATTKTAIIPTLERLCKVDTDGRLHMVMVKTVESFLKQFNPEVLLISMLSGSRSWQRRSSHFCW